MKNADTIGGRIKAVEAGVKAIKKTPEELARILRDQTKQSIENTMSNIINTIDTVADKNLKVFTNNKDVHLVQNRHNENGQPIYNHVKGEQVSYIKFDNRLN